MLRREIAAVFLLFVCNTFQQLTNGQGQVPVVLNVRLADGSATGRDGRVEIQYNGVWGTICADGWTVQDAGVVCRMLGFLGPGKEIPGNVYPPGPNNMPIWLRAVQCDGNEPNLGSCPYQGWNNTGCSHDRDAGVVCLGERAPTTISTLPRTTGTTPSPTICNNPNQNIRLVDANNTVAQTPAGRVQILYNSSWRSICNDRWDVPDASVVCRMLCYNPVNAKAIIGTGVYGNASEGFWLSDVNCGGNELTIDSCPKSPYGGVTCDADKAAAVSCVVDTPTPPPLPAPTVDCSNERLTASFSKATNPRLQGQHLSVPDTSGATLPNCQYTTFNDSNNVYISIPFTGGNCNTSREMNETYILYTNVIRYAVPYPSDVITRTDIYYVTVHCLINRTQSPDNSFNPESRTPPPQSGDGKYNVSLLLFEDGSFKTAVRENPLRVTLGDWVYAGVQLFSTDPNLKLVLDNLYVTPYAEPNTQPMYYLIQNKCIVEPTVTLYPMNDTLFALRFQSFKFVSNYTYMYLHSFVHVCGVRETTGQCNRNCLTPTGVGRKRRDIGHFESHNIGHAHFELGSFGHAQFSVSVKGSTALSVSDLSIRMKARPPSENVAPIPPPSERNHKILEAKDYHEEEAYYDDDDDDDQQQHDDFKPVIKHYVKAAYERSESKSDSWSVLRDSVATWRLLAALPVTTLLSTILKLIR